MPKDKNGKKVPLSLEESKRLKGSAAELEAFEKVKSEKEAENKLKTTETIKAKKLIVRDKKTGRAMVGTDTARVAGEEDQGPSAAPKIQLKGPVVSTGKTLARKGLRAPKRGELKRGITVIQTEKNPTETRTRTRKRNTKVIAKPQPGQAGKLDGKIVRVTPENLTQVYDQKRRTELPAVQAPEPEKPRTLAPGAGARRENVFVDPRKASGEQATRRLKGLAVPHKMIAPAVNQAMEHLRGMAATKGTPEYHEHVAGFNAIHPTILGMDSTIHHALGAMAHHTMYPKQDSHSVITQITAAIGDRLSEGRSMEVQRAQRQRGNTNGS
jgi:hypothetical protein